MTEATTAEPEAQDLNVRDAGSGKPLLLLHGVGGSLHDWEAVLPHFRDRFRTVRLDARGHGGSHSPAGNWRLDDFTDDVARVLDERGIDRVSIAGYSMGALITQAFALRFPDRVERLAMIAATTGRTAAEQAQIKERLAFIQSFAPGEYFDAYARRRWFTEAFVREAPEVVAGCRTRLEAVDPEGYAKAYHVLTENDLADRLHEIRVPTLVMTAENDIGAGPRVARLIADRIAGAELLIVPRLRHQLLLEAPDIVGGVLREFFSS